MGNTIWIEAEGRAADETHEDMSVLLRLDEKLDALAVKLGVTKLTDFYDYEDLLESFGEEEEDEAEELPETLWFDATTGLHTINTLLLTLENSFVALDWKPDGSETHWPQTLLEDLQFCKAILEEAVANGRRFRLLIVA